MKQDKIFVISDIHGFYDEMRAALRRVGFQKNNPKHLLIVCGDIFDRGPDSVKVYKFLKSLPSGRRILIRGNHEYLLRAALERGFFLPHDYHNGTVDTINQFIEHYYPSLTNFNDTTKIQSFLNLGVVRWIFGHEWCHFYEYEQYVFVHGWIPLEYKYDKWGYCIGRKKILNKWREASEKQWEQASWECPWACYQEGNFLKKNIIVCGHWHTSDFRKHLHVDDEDLESNKIFKTSNLIGLDACTALTKYCNVLVINDNGVIENI